MNATLLLALAAVATGTGNQIVTVPNSPFEALLAVNQAHLNVIKDLPLTSPESAYNLAYFHEAIHGAFNEVNFNPICLGNKLQRAQVNVIVLTAVYVLQALYPRHNFNGLLKRVVIKKGDFCDKLTASASSGSAKKVLLSRQNDGSQPKADPDFRVGALVPHWGGVRPFGIFTAAHYVPKATELPALGSDEYKESMKDVISLGRDKDSTRTDDHTRIAYFWDTGAKTYTIPGQWNLIAHAILRNRRPSLANAVRILRTLNVAMADAGIVCWATKYQYNSWRPITAIRETQKIEWAPLLDTPASPEFISEHSTFAGAAGAVLYSYFGDETPFSLEYFGQRRTYQKISQARDEAGLSRIYGGVNFGFSHKVGINTGYTVGQIVWTKHLQK